MYDAILGIPWEIHRNNKILSRCTEIDHFVQESRSYRSGSKASAMPYVAQSVFIGPARRNRRDRAGTRLVYLGIWRRVYVITVFCRILTTMKVLILDRYVNFFIDTDFKEVDQSSQSSGTGKISRYTDITR